MADRRGFIGKLLTFCGLAAIAPAITLPESPKRDYKLLEMKRFSVNVADRFIYKGFLVYWTGWKPASNFDILICQWCAWKQPVDGYETGLYASHPGIEGSYHRGAIFDVSIQKSQWDQVPTRGTSEEKLQQYKMLCLQRLMKLIDERVSVRGRALVG